MNLKILRWLLAHRDVLIKVLEAAKRYSRSAPLIEQWAIVDEIARIVIPVLEKEGVDVGALLWSVDDEVEAFAAGAEVSALGVDWKTIIDILLPILIQILRAISSISDE
jgi:hypothetical protein